MRLKSLELNIKLPVDIELPGFRVFILKKLKDYGEPLRWAITSSNLAYESDVFRYLKIEAVVIIL